MQDHSALRLVSLGAFILVLSPLASAQSVEAITKPSEDVTLSFVRAGAIAQILVKEGDTVAAGQLLVKQDDTAELVNLEQLQAEAESTVRVEAAQAQLDEKKVEYNKMRDADVKGAVSKWDVDRARLAVEIADLSLQLARFEHTQNGRKRDEAKLQIDRMSIRSPIAGRVEKLFVQPGEAADALEDVIRVVKIDPLWIDVPVPLPRARSLAVGRPVTVLFGPAQGESTQGRLILIAAVADAASDTISCRIALPNPAARPAGEHVNVNFLPSGDK